MHQVMHGVAELPSYIRVADKLLSLQERQDLIDYLAEHPKAGDLMEGTGGVRKLRWRHGAARARVGEYASSITTMMTLCLYIC